MHHNSINNTCEAYEGKIQLSEQIPKTLFKHLKQVILHTINYQEFVPKLKTVDQNTTIGTRTNPNSVNIIIDNFKGKRYFLEYGKSPLNDGGFFNILIFEDKVNGSMLFKDTMYLFTDNDFFITKKITTKPLAEQYKYFRQEYFNRVSIMLLKAFKTLKEEGTEPVLVSTLQQIAAKVQVNTFAQPVGVIPTELQSLNTVFKNFYDKL